MEIAQRRFNFVFEWLEISSYLFAVIYGVLIYGNFKYAEFVYHFFVEEFFIRNESFLLKLGAACGEYYE